MENRVRTAVIGLRKGKDHVRAYHYAPNTELRWVVDLDEQLAAETAATYNCRYTTKLEDVFGDVDAVSVCTPHFLHYEHGMAAMGAGKHVLIEKPLALSEQECDGLLREADARGVKLAVGMQLRNLPSLQYLKRALDSGEFGQVVNIDVWQEGLMEAERGAYRSSKAMIGGGVLFSMGCHYLDMMLLLMGKPVEAIGIGGRIGTEWMEGEGTAKVIASFPNGAVGHLTSSWGMQYRNTPARIQVHTTKAVLLMDLAMTKIEAIDGGGRRTVFEEQPLQFDGVEWKGSGVATFYQIQNFAESIQRNTTPINDGHSSMVTFRTIWDIYRRWEA